MSKQIFDQNRPRSTMAQRLDEAFAGCDEWTVIKAPRRSDILFAEAVPTKPSRIFDGDILGPQRTEAL
ncbi:MAG TPA: hypothetical protein VKB23_05705 [Solirubrobacterales bacterium]|nr:hypothetical protein [Solirubrobacterales bacterium]